MICALLARLHLTRARPRFEPTVPAHITVCPPTRRGGDTRLGLWRRLRARWADSSLTAAARASHPPASVTPLWAVRLEFMRALHGVHTQQAGDMLDRIGRARSLRDLWHLRAEVFDLIAHHHDQAEAHARLASLNQHFPIRAPSIGAAGPGLSLSRTKVIA